MHNNSAETPLRVCYFGTYRQHYGRNQIMIAGLRAQGATVYECHETLWHGIDDRVQQVRGGLASGGAFCILIGALSGGTLRRRNTTP